MGVCHGMSLHSIAEQGRSRVLARLALGSVSDVLALVQMQAWAQATGTVIPACEISMVGSGWCRKEVWKRVAR